MLFAQFSGSASRDQIPFDRYLLPVDSGSLMYPTFCCPPTNPSVTDVNTSVTAKLTVVKSSRAEPDTDCLSSFRYLDVGTSVDAMPGPACRTTDSNITLATNGTEDRLRNT